jgi:hypothetical protein
MVPTGALNQFKYLHTAIVIYWYPFQSFSGWKDLPFHGSVSQNEHTNVWKISSDQYSNCKPTRPQAKVLPYSHAYSQVHNFFDSTSAASIPLRQLGTRSFIHKAHLHFHLGFENFFY